MDICSVAHQLANLLIFEDAGKDAPPRRSVLPQKVKRSRGNFLNAAFYWLQKMNNGEAPLVQVAVALEPFACATVEFPAEEVFKPNYDVSCAIFAKLLELAVGTDTSAQYEAVTQICATQNVPAVFKYILLSTFALKNNFPKQAYEYGKRAYAYFAHRGAAYRAYYAGYEACKRYRIEDIAEKFPVGDFYKKHFCSYPFDTLFISCNPQSDVYFVPCRTTFWHAHGKRVEGDDTDAWNSSALCEIRRSILDGDFTYCSKVRCPRIGGNKLPLRDEILDPYLKAIIKNKTTKLDQGPLYIVLGHDHTCNLKCPSCRKHKVIASKKKIAEYDDLVRRTVLPVLTPETHTIKLSNSGEVFVSKHFLRFIRELPWERLPKLKLELMTNGEFVADCWKHLGEGRNHVRLLQFSFDGLSKETYWRYRASKNFKNYLRGVEFAKKLLDEGIIESIQSNTTVYEGNLSELKAMYFFALEHQYSIFTISKIENWGAFSAEEFNRINVWNLSHPRHKELVQLIAELKKFGYRYPQMEVRLTTEI